VLFVDLRAAGVQGDGGSTTGAGFGAVEEGLAFIQAIRQSVSHPPIVALCDAESVDFGREVMQHGAYDKLTAPLNMSQLRLALQRAYEFRLAETKLESFLTAQTVAHDHPRNTARRKAGASMRAAAASSRPMRRARQQSAPSRLALGFVLGGVVFFAGLVAVRTIMSGTGNALAGSAPDSSVAASSNPTATESRPSSFSVRRMWPLTATADFSQGGLDEDSAHRRFHPDAELALPHSSLPGYEPAAIIERVSPRYSLEARSRHLQGTVRIRAVIGKDGVPRGIARVSGDPTLAQIAMDAVALWRYAPATIDGEPVESEAMIPIDFKLPD
jgi:TonB family protein